MEKNWISVNIQGRNVQALVDSGADYSVISEAFRRSIKAPVFKENGPLLRAADKKFIMTLDLKLCAAMDCVIPPKSFGKLIVPNEDVFGSRDVVLTGSKHLQSGVVGDNSTHQSQMIPSDMKVGTMQDLEVGSISNLDASSEIAGKDEVTSPDVRECLISMISTDLGETKKNRLLTCLNEFADIFDFEKRASLSLAK
ncbi:hypothetical protein LAZ67_2006595 [Cordylochernes scorpioides]|uniref:Peptidase A2 domain-containing protein n=1 Tax=Cordylochernes scorpioides TaxID=51811 RepID=A0ABY6K740_9ARAC|nr:hypothetical protein LAZ67_2006595 [Cordylochernes scorpioides]